MKRKIFSVLFALVLALSLCLVTAVPVAAQETSTFTVTDGTYTTAYVDDENGDIAATMTGSWDAAVIGEFSATGTGGLYVPGTGPPEWGTTADITVSGTLSAGEITFSGTAVRTAGDPITNDEVTNITGTIIIQPDGSFVADLTGVIAGPFTVDIDITGSMVRPIINENTGESFFTIQAAIDDADTLAGHTINVAAGEYAGAIVNKDVVIIGAAGGASIITSGVPYKVGTTLYTGFRLDDGADGAEIRNFTINGDYDNSFYFAVYARSTDNVIIDALTVNAMRQGITNWGGSGWQITNNVLDNTFPQIEGPQTGGGIAIQLGADPSTFPHCDNNLVQGNIMSTSAEQSSSFTGAAIALWFDMRGVKEMPTDVSMTSNEIIGNSITASGLENQVGIEIGVGGLYGDDNPDKVAACLGVIHGNTVTNNTIDNAEWGLHLYVTTDLTVSGNTIKNCSDCGIFMKDDSVNCLINNNDIYGNTNHGLNNSDGATYKRTVDATNNWWGSINGPTHTGNTFNVGEQGNAVSNYVDYVPWCNIDKTGASFAPVTITAPVDSFASIQAGVNASDPNGTVNVAAGTYEETVTIDKSLTLEGAQAGVDPTVEGARVTPPMESIVTGVCTIKASDIVLDGFTIDGTVYVDDSASAITDATISNNIITGDSYGIRVGTASNNVISQLIIEYNEIIGNTNKGICFWKVDWQAGNLHDVTIRGNTISGNDKGGISTYGAGPYFILDNTVTENLGNGISIKYDDGDVVTGNTVTNNDAMGINMHEVTNCTVENNTITGHISEEVVTTFWGGSVVAGKGSGIYIHEASVGNTVTLNTITGNNNGILVNKEVEGVDPSGNSINLNTIADNLVLGIINTTPNNVDATNNWWGHETGPQHATLNPDGLGNAVSDNVNFDPWLSGYPNPPTVVTAAASSRRTTSATLNATLDDLGSALEVAVSFEWGTTTAYGNETTTQEMTSTGTFTASLTGLSSNTTHYFRAVAVGHGTSYSTGTFATTAEPAPSPPPTYYTATNLFGTEKSFRISRTGEILKTIEATSEDGMLTMTIPEGTIALGKDSKRLKSLQAIVDDSPPDPPEDAHIIGLAYDFGSDGATFDPAITFTWSYDPETLPEDVAKEDLVLAYYDEEAGEWVELDGVVDTVNNTITASVAHFTTFAIIGSVTPPPVPPAPARFTINSLGVSPSELAPSEEVNISVLVANTGGESGSYSVVLKINGVKEQEKSVTIAAGSSQEVSFSVTREEADTYAVTVDGLSGSFTVAPVVVTPEPAAFSVSYLSFSQLEVEPGEAVTITMLVANTGGESGSYTVVLKIDGIKEAEETVTIAAGESQDVSFSATREEPGNYTVAVDGLSGSFTVLLLVEPPGVNWTLIGGIIAAAVIVVGLLYYFLVFRRRAY